MEPTTPPDHLGNSGKPADEGSATADKSATEGQHAFVTIRILGIDGFTHANLAKDRMVVGCSFAADLPIMHTSVTRKHCVFTREGDAWFVENIDSSHGYRVNKPQAVISGKVKLSPNDTIACGQARLTFQLGNATSIHQIKEAQSSEIGKSFTDDKEIAAATSTSADTQRSAKAGSANGQPQRNDEGGAVQQHVLMSLKKMISAIPRLVSALFSKLSFVRLSCLSSSVPRIRTVRYGVQSWRSLPVIFPTAWLFVATGESSVTVRLHDFKRKDIFENKVRISQGMADIFSLRLINTCC